MYSTAPIVSCNSVIYLFQAYLSSQEPGNSVDQVEKLVKKHDAFQNLLSKHDQKVSKVPEQGETDY